VRLGTRLALGLAAATYSASYLQAQGRSEPREGPSWALRGLRSDQCVHFLVDPGTAAKLRRDGYRPIRADRDQSLHSALRGVTGTQPEFAAWIPSSLCLFYVDTITVGGRTMVERNARKPQMIVIWTLATAEQGSGTRRDLVLHASASSSRVVRAAEASKLRIREARWAVSRVPNSPDELHDLKIGKTHLVWSGRAVGDSTPIEQPIRESWLIGGVSGTTWNVLMTLKPKWSRPLVGVLRVDGKDDLATSLKASPIRFVGPRYLGGSADLRFTR
jgi:hypothetical protein